MRRRVLTGLMMVCMFLSTFTHQATRATFSPNLSFSGTTASCSVVIKQFGKQISATMELWHGSTLVDSWSGTKTNALTLNETHSGCISGWTYTLKINGTIGGIAFSEITLSETC